MMRRAIALVWAAALLGGCAAYTRVPAGAVAVGDLQLTPVSAWNKAPPPVLPHARKGSAVWTLDGLLLDRLVIIPAVPDGEPLFEDREGDAALPTFAATMLPNELVELTESSVVKLMGEGSAAVSTSNLRPHRYGAHAGILLDLDASVSDGPDYKGLAGAFVASRQLYFMLYLAATPYYYDLHLPEAEAIIKSAVVIAPQAGRGGRPGT